MKLSLRYNSINSSKSISEPSRTKNAIRNISFGLVNKIVHLIFPFIIRSITIQVLGVEYLGLGSLFTSILQVLNLAELGFSSAVIYNMYKPIAEKDHETICALLNLYKRIYRIIGAVILSIGLLILPFLRNFIDGDIPSSANIYILYSIYLFNTVSTYFVFAYKGALLNACQRNDIVSNVHTLISIAQFSLQILVLLLLKNYYVFVIIQCFASIINNLLVAYIAKRKYPNYVCNGEVTVSQRRDIRKRVFGLMIQNVCGTTRNSLDSVFISAMVGLTAVAIYSNYYAIMAAIIGLIGIVASSITAIVGNSIVTESEEKNYRDMNKFNFLYMWISGWLTICLACLYQPLMELWMGKENMFSYDVVLLFCVYFYSLKMGDMRALYSDAKGLWYENRFRAIVETAANIILNLVLGYFFGVYGIIAGTLISLLIINFGYGSRILFKYYFIHQKVSQYFLRHALYALATLVVGSITYFICSFVDMEGAIGIIVKVLVCMSLPNILYLLIYRNTGLYKEAVTFVKKLVPKISKR